jgi:uncharacterized membrane protein
MSADKTERTGIGRLRTYFLTGLIIVAPLTITAYLVWGFIGWVDGWIKPYLPPEFNPDNYLPFALPGIGLVVALFTITMIGFLTANFVGRQIVHLGERVVNKMPLVRNIYGGLKQIFETVLSNKANSFKTVALIEYPRKGVWALAFVATDTQGEIKERLQDVAGDTVAVFMASTPNPTTGFLMFFPKADVMILKMSVEDCAKLVISAGLVNPEQQQEKVRAIAAIGGVKLPDDKSSA